MNSLESGMFQTVKIVDLPEVLVMRIFAMIPSCLHHGLVTCKAFSSILIGSDNFPLYYSSVDSHQATFPSGFSLLRYTGSISLRMHADGDSLQSALLSVLDAAILGWSRIESLEISCVSLPPCAAATILRPILQRQTQLR
jgi:hypothetical protein